MLEKYKVFTGLFFGALWVLLTFGFISGTPASVDSITKCRDAALRCCISHPRPVFFARQA